MFARFDASFTCNEKRSTVSSCFESDVVKAAMRRRQLFQAMCVARRCDEVRPLAGTSSTKLEDTCKGIVL
jgi:hypothetical protein